MKSSNDVEESQRIRESETRTETDQILELRLFKRI